MSDKSLEPRLVENFEPKVSNDPSFVSLLEGYMKDHNLDEKRQHYQELAYASFASYPEHPEFWIGEEKTRELYEIQVKEITQDWD